MVPTNVTLATATPAQPEELTKDVKDSKYKNIKKSSNSASEILTHLAELKWLNFVVITVVHGIFLVKAFSFPYVACFDLVIFNTLYGSIGATGVSAGAHRLWTHRAYKATLPLRIILMLCHCSTGMGPVHEWVRDHRVHHKYVDTDADPYNARRGFFFSHVGWLFKKKHPKVIEMGKQVDMSDVLEDPVIQFQQKHYIPLLLGVGFIIPSIVPPLLWGSPWYWSIIGACVGRWVIILNLIWSINSVSHFFGNKPYDKYATATDNLSSSLITLGESWHNYHHAFPWAYKLGRFTNFYTDPSGFWIDVFSQIEWAYDLKTPSLELVKKASLRAGDGSHPIWGADMEIPESAEEELLLEKKG